MRTMAWRRPFLPAKSNKAVNIQSVGKRRNKPTIGTGVSKKVAEPLGHAQARHTEGDTNSSNKSVSSSPLAVSQDSDTRGSDSTKQEGGETANDRAGGSTEYGAEFTNDTHQEQDESTHVTGRTRSVSSKGDDTGVLGKGGKRWDSGETGNGGHDRVCKHAALNPGHKTFTRNF